jgi:hypothetical protein
VRKKVEPTSINLTNFTRIILHDVSSVSCSTFFLSLILSFLTLCSTDPLLIISLFSEAPLIKQEAPSHTTTNAEHTLNHLRSALYNIIITLDLEEMPFAKATDEELTPRSKLSHVGNWRLGPTLGRGAYGKFWSEKSVAVLWVLTWQDMSDLLPISADEKQPAKSSRHFIGFLMSQ